jgi:hypothetical protein
MLWELQLRRVKLDGAVNVITNLVKKRMGLGECEDAAFYTAMHMFSWWMDECELCTKADATPFFIEWMDDEYYELDLDWEHSNCNPSHPKTRGIAKI